MSAGKRTRQGFRPVQEIRIMSTLSDLTYAVGLFFGVVVSGASFCQEPELATDRPDFTESSVVVPRASVQIEAGATWLGEAGGGVEVLSGPEALIRWGVAPRLELRFGLPDYLEVSGTEVDDGAWTDSSIGLKWQLGPVAEAWDLALVAEVEIPSGEIEVTAERYDPGMILITGTDLSDRWSLGAQLSAARQTFAEVGGDREVWFWGGTAVFGLGVSDDVGTFFEVAAEKPEDVETLVFLHHGWTWLPAPRLQLDAHVAAGLTDTTPDWLIGIGCSKRW
jgi:hypothetical protein